MKEIEVEEAKDTWGDKVWVVGTRTYRSRQEAMKAVSELMEEEYRQRYLEGVNKK